MPDQTRIPLMGRADRLNAMAEKQGEVLGHIAADSPLLSNKPQPTAATWEGPSGHVDMEEGPPPWELEDYQYSASDARRFVDVPANWKLFWINPRLLESSGMRYWQAISASDPRVNIKVKQMHAPDGLIRREGEKGDILCWMYASWYASLQARTRLKTDQQTQAALDKVDSLREDFNRGKFGPYVHLDSALHPTHTQATIRNPTD